MKRAAFVLAALGLTAASPAPEQEVRIWGPASMRELAERWAADYTHAHHEVRFELTMKGSDTAVPGLYSGKADIALMGRETTITDDNGFGRVKGYAPTKLELFGGSLASEGKSPALAVLVPADNPLHSISFAQLRALFGVEGKAARTWGDLGLGGKWQAVPVHLHMPDAASGTGRWFEDHVLLGGRKLNWAAISEYQMGGTSAPTWPKIAAAVRTDPAALGIGTVADMAGLRAVPVSAGPDAHVVAPTGNTLASGVYPLARHAYALIDRKPGGPIDPALQAFLRYAAGPEGQAAVAAGHDWLPATAEQRSRALAAIANPGDPVPSAAALSAVAALPAYQPHTQVSGTISIWGHGSFKRDFMGRLVRRWFTEFHAVHPGARLDYRMYGTASAIGALATGAGNLALLGEEISPEQIKQFERARGYAPTSVEVANGSLQTNFFDYAHMIYVHRDNPLTHLTMLQLGDILAADSRCDTCIARKWGDLGLIGEWADQPITPHIWKTDTDFAQLLRERALAGGHRWNPALKEVLVANKPDGTPYELGQHLLDDLAKDRFGIAASNIRYHHAQVKSLALGWTSLGPFVEASDATLIDRSYPLGRIIPAYVDRKPGAKIDPLVAEFLRYMLSRDGQRALIEESAYLPLSGEIAARERAKLK